GILGFVFRPQELARARAVVVAHEAEGIARLAERAPRAPVGAARQLVLARADGLAHRHQRSRRELARVRGGLLGRALALARTADLQGAHGLALARPELHQRLAR